MKDSLKTKEGIIFIGRTFNEVLKTSGLSQAEIAFRLDMNPSSLCRLLKRKKKVSVEQYLKILNLIDIVPLVILVDKRELSEEVMKKLQNKDELKISWLKSLLQLFEAISGVKIIICIEE